MLMNSAVDGVSVHNATAGFPGVAVAAYTFIRSLENWLFLAIIENRYKLNQICRDVAFLAFM